MTAHGGRDLLGLLTVSILLSVPLAAQARCGDAAGDLDAVAAAREAIAAQCNCSTAATSHAGYVKCARAIARAAKAAGTLPSSCLASVMRCVNQSAIGRSGAVVCCTTGARGTRARIKSNASMCKPPRGGTACVAYELSVCDGCDATGCVVPPTSTPAPTPTPTPVICPQALVPIPPNLVTVPLTLSAGSPDCGGPRFNPPAAPPFSGEVDDVDGVKLADLGLGCLYAGGLPALSVPAGTTAGMSVVGVSASTLVLGPSDGTGPTNCSRGAGPATHCINGQPGTDMQGTCASDADCAGAVGACAPDAHCFFGPPIPTGVGAVGACVMNTLASDICGSADMSGNAQVLANISARLYASLNVATPCPLCVSGTCTDGPNAGQPCTVGGTAGTSVDCPPDPAQFFTSLSIRIAPLTTASSSLEPVDGQFCPRTPTPTPKQERACVRPVIPSAFGLTNVGSIHEVGSGILSGGTQLSVALGGTFCVPPTGSFLDTLIGPPLPGAISASGKLDLTNALPLLGGVLP